MNVLRYFTNTSLSRSTFVQAVEGLLDKSAIHFNKHCTSIDTSGQRNVVHFKDGSTYTTDLVIGADGIRSATRNAVTRDSKSQPVFTNTVAYRGLFSADRLHGVETDLTLRPTNFVSVNKVCFSRNMVTHYLSLFLAYHRISSQD
jgi:salicylate hydroxylase